MRFAHKKLWICRLFCCLLPVVVPLSPAAEPSTVKIIRDGYGVPHIYADDTYSLYYGYGYAVGQDRLFQMEMLKRTTSGRVAEALGKDYLDIDITVRTGFDPAALREQVEQLDDSQSAPFRGYADGISHWIEEVMRDTDRLLPKEFIDFGFTPYAWTAYDVFLVIVGALAHRYADFNEEINNLAFLKSLQQQHGSDKAWRIFNATLPIYDNASPVTVPDEDAQRRTIVYRGEEEPAYLQSIYQDAIDAPPPLTFDESGRFKQFADAKQQQAYAREQFSLSGIPGTGGYSSASNVWVLGRSKTREAQGILVNGPQFGWINPSYVYGVGLHGGGLDVVGNTLLAVPFLLFAHNGAISWGSTAGFGDLVDIFVSRLNPENENEYWHDGRYRPLSVRNQKIAIKDAADVTHTFYYSHYGPVVLYDKAAGRIYSKKRAWEGREMETCLAWMDMARTGDFATWRQQLAIMSTNINLYYLDKDGNIGYTHTGRYPLRNTLHDNRLPAPGDGSMDWLGYTSFEHNPYVYNPKQGYINNWNNRPEHDWRNSDLWWRRWGKAERVDILIDELEAKVAFSSREAWDINSRSSFADVNFRYLNPMLADKMKRYDAPQAVKSAFQALQNWDGYWRDQNEDGYFDTAAPIIMQTWLTKLCEDVLKDDIGEEFFFRFASPGYPVDTVSASIAVSPCIKTIVNSMAQSDGNNNADYDFFNGSNPADVLLTTFSAAISQLVDRFGNDIGQWRVKTHPQIFSTFNFRGVAQTTADNTLQLPVIMNRGSENNLFVANGSAILGWDSFAPGQSGFLAPDGSKARHYDDQMELYQQFKHKFLPFSREEVNNAKETEISISIKDKY